MFLAVPKTDHGKIRSHIISQNIVDCEVPKFCEIFCEILISQNIICFGKYCEKISWKYLFGKIAFYLKIFFSFWKILLAKGVWVEKVLEKFSTWLQIDLGNVFGKFYFHLSSNRVKIVFYKDFIFLKFKVSFSCSKDFTRLQAMFN